LRFLFHLHGLAKVVMLKENEQYFALIFHSALVYVPEGISEEELSLLNHSKVSEAHFLLVVHGVYLIE
jgi:hypothetical protein